MLLAAFGWPCGLHDLASLVHRRRLAKVRLVRLPWESTLLQTFQPHILALRAEAGGLDSLRNLIRQSREQFPEITVILGGPTATSHPAELLDATDADYVFIGEAEETLIRFLEAAADPLLRGRSRDCLPQINGIAYRWGERIFVNLPPETPVQNRAWPFPSESLLRENQLDWSLLEHFCDNNSEPFDSLYLVAGRGCPGRCAFCSQLHGHRVRTKTLEQLLEEIREGDALVTAGKLPVGRFPLFEHVTDPRMPRLRSMQVRWLSIFDEDFFLDRDRAVSFLRHFAMMPQSRRYRLSMQTNPRSLLKQDRPDPVLFEMIDRLKPMIQLGAESFHPDVLKRWNKRHDIAELETILDALDRTRQDYTVFHIQADYHTDRTELIASTRLLLEAAERHPAMRIASSALMIPLYDTDIRRSLPSDLSCRIKHFTDYERPHPEWLEPGLAQLLDQLDEILQDALFPAKRLEFLQRCRQLIDGLSS